MKLYRIALHAARISKSHTHIVLLHDEWIWLLERNWCFYVLADSYLYTFTRVVFILVVDREVAADEWCDLLEGEEIWFYFYIGSTTLLTTIIYSGISERTQSDAVDFVWWSYWTELNWNELIWSDLNWFDLDWTRFYMQYYMCLILLFLFKTVCHYHRVRTQSPK